MSTGTALQQVATRLSVSESELKSIVMNTIMPNNGQGVSNEQFVAFLAVANEYKLNPLTKEIYAYPAKKGGIQPIVSIDGWLKIINSHPDFNGMVFEDERDDNKNLVSINCKIYRKGVDHPITVTEYMGECQGPKEDKYGNLTPWGRWPARMLRHKTAIQAGRYAFGLSGIIDPDEAERYKDAGVIEMGEAERATEEFYPSDKFESSIKTWTESVEEGKKTPDQILAFLVKKEIKLSPEQVEIVTNLKKETE